MSDAVRIKFRIHGHTAEREVKGRYAWTLGKLVDAGNKGVTPIERPAPRWSHYVDILRDREGLDIETVEEKHGGPFKGWHGRYVLHSELHIIEREEANG
jgi:hypothetical protein